MITYYYRAPKGESLEEKNEACTGVWAHVVAPTEEETKKLFVDFGLDVSILKDATDFFEVPRLERSGNAVYFFTRYPYEEREEEIDTAPILIVIGESFVLTVVLMDAPFLASFIGGLHGRPTTARPGVFIEMISLLVDAYSKELARMRKGVSRSRNERRRVRNRNIELLVRYENSLNDIIEALVPTYVWLSSVSGGNYLQLFKEDVAHVDDLVIAVNQLIDSAKSILKTIQNIRSAHESILTNNLNMTIRMLAALTVVLTIPMIVTSLYGMNVALPLQDHPHAFWLIVVLIVASMSLVLYFFSRNRWL